LNLKVTHADADRPMELFCGPLIGAVVANHTAVAMLYKDNIHRAMGFSLHNF
jgi:hypothetical protein